MYEKIPSEPPPPPNATYFFTGSTGELIAYRWSDLSGADKELGGGESSSKRRKKATDASSSDVGVETAWRVRVADAQEAVDVNSLAVDASGFGPAGQLVVGGGDGAVRTVDVETGAVVGSNRAHGDFVHGVSLCPQTGLVASAGEDGLVCLWDRRAAGAAGGAAAAGKKKAAAAAGVRTLTPSSQKQLARPKLGKWVGAVALSGEWMVGGIGRQN